MNDFISGSVSKRMWYPLGKPTISMRTTVPLSLYNEKMSSTTATRLHCNEYVYIYIYV